MAPATLPMASANGRCGVCQCKWADCQCPAPRRPSRRGDAEFTHVALNDARTEVAPELQPPSPQESDMMSGCFCYFTSRATPAAAAANPAAPAAGAAAAAATDLPAPDTRWVRDAAGTGTVRPGKYRSTRHPTPREPSALESKGPPYDVANSIFQVLLHGVL